MLHYPSQIITSKRKITENCTVQLQILDAMNKISIAFKDRSGEKQSLVQNRGEEQAN
jgi:hypothetical protein